MYQAYNLRNKMHADQTQQ